MLRRTTLFIAVSTLAFLSRSFGQIPSELAMPAGRRDELLRQLTPLENVVDRAVSLAKPGESGCVVESETMVIVDEEGRKLLVHHSAYKTLTEAGIKSNGEDTFTFRKREQKGYVLLAETIEPDGTHLPVRTDAMLVQSPQMQAQYSLYDDTSEVRIIYPGVVPGSITHVVTVVEDLQPKIPREFLYSFYPTTGTWGAGFLRCRVTVPNGINERLKIVPFGTVLAPKITQERGRSIYEWRLERLPSTPYEIGRAPLGETGPVINLTTLPTWDAVAQWYSGLVKGHETVGPALARTADSWVKGMDARAEIIRTLHAHIADEIRYVGLELGAADYQPHDCNQVWESRYGDCKDKANLLAALLRRRGIDAHLALVNTTHAGVVDKRAPDYREFNHAIVAVAQPGGGYLFCDPTLEFSRPGLLSPEDSDRDVLVVLDRGAAWAHTPDQDAGSLRYDFALKLTAAGELSGWLTLASDGYYGARDRGDFGRLDHDELRAKVSDIVEGFFKGAQIIDVAPVKRSRDAGYSWKAYFVVAAKAEDGDGRRTLVFPRSLAVFADVGDTPDRETTYFTYRDDIKVTATIELPHGLVPTKLPHAIKIDARAVRGDAHWEFRDGICRTELSLLTRASLLSPASFKEFYRATGSLQAWLSEPVLLATKADTALEKADPAIDLPLMPTGDGEISLVDQRYPENGNPDRRARALERAIQYFPDDKLTVFRASVRLAQIDWNADRNDAADRRLHALLSAYAGQVNGETFAWAELIEAGVLTDLKRNADAVVLCRRVLADEALTADRRAEAATRLADLTLGDAPKETLAAAKRIAELPDGLTADLESRLVHLILIVESPDAAVAYLNRLGNDAKAQDRLTSVLRAAANWKQPGDDRRIAATAEIAVRLVEHPNGDLAAAIDACREEGTNRSVRAAVVSALTKPPLAAWYARDDSDQGRTLGSYDDEISAAEKAGDSLGSLRLTLRSLAAGGEGDFPRRLWQAANFAEWAERNRPGAIDEAVCTALLPFCDALPRSNDYYFEGRLLRARRFNRASRWPDEQMIFRDLLAEPKITDVYKVVVATRLGLSLEQSGDFGGARSAYRLDEPFLNDYKRADQGALHAVLIALHEGDDTEANRILGLLEHVPEKTIDATEAKDQLKELMALHRSGGATQYWRRTRAWWPKWKDLSTQAGSKPGDIEQVVPEIDDLHAIGEVLGTAGREANRAQFWRQLDILGSAARWQPSLATELAGVLGIVGQYRPDQVKLFKKVTEELLRVPVAPVTMNYRARRMWLAAYLCDTDRAVEALQIGDEFDSTEQPLDNVTLAMHRVYAQAAQSTGSQLTAAVAILEKDLEGAANSETRALSTLYLARTYGRLGQAKQEKELLARELTNPVTLASAETTTELRKLQNLLTAGDRWSAAITRWVQTSAPAWYALAEPQTLDDPRYSDVERIIHDEEHGGLAPLEWVKFQLLAAQVPQRSVTDRQQSFGEGVRGLIVLSKDYEEIDRLVGAVVDDADFDQNVRGEVLWTALNVLAAEGRRSEFERWRKNQLCDLFVADRIKLLDETAALDRSSNSAISAFGAALTQRELTPYALKILDDQIDLLLRRGDIDAAAKLTAGAGAWNLSSEVQVSREALQLTYVKKLRAAREINPLHESLRALVVHEFPSSPVALPPQFAKRRMFLGVPTLDSEPTFAACRYLIERREFDRTSVDFWRTFIRAVDNRPGTVAFIERFVAAAIQGAAGDAPRESVVSSLIYGVDLDNPSIRQALEAAMAPYRQPTREPATYAAIRRYESIRDLRLGKPVVPETFLADLHDPESVASGRQFRLQNYVVRDDRAALNKLLDEIDPGTLLKGETIYFSLAAYRAAQRNDELVLATSVAERELRSLLVSAWAMGGESTVTRAASLALEIGRPDLLPDTWVEAMRTGTDNVFVAHVVVLTKAELHRDWTTAAHEASALTQLFPRRYHYFWYLGQALQRLGRDDEAAAALETYTRYAYDEFEYPQAVKLLESLRNKTAKLPATSH